MDTIKRLEELVEALKKLGMEQEANITLAKLEEIKAK